MLQRGHTAELAGIAVCLLAGVFYLAQALHLARWTPGGVPASGFLPTLLGVAMIVLSLTLLVKTLGGPPAPQNDGRKIDFRALAKPTYTLLVLVGYVILFPTLGFAVTSLAMIWALMWVFDPETLRRRKAARAAGLALLVVALFHMVFINLLALQIPVWPFSD